MSRVGGQTKFMTSRQGAVAGCVGDACGGGNISRQRVRIAAGGRKRRRTRRKQPRKHRGGAHGVIKADHIFGRGYTNVDFVDTCSQYPSPAKVHQTGGYSLMDASVYPNSIPYHGYTGGKDVALFKGGIAPVTVYERGSCGGGKNKKRRQRKKKASKSKGKRRRTKRKTRGRRHKKTRRTRRHRGGSGPLPSSPGFVLPGEALPATRSAEANSSPAGRNHFNGTGRCLDNYDHYTGTSRKN